jgi:hypothetical protein
MRAMILCLPLAVALAGDADSLAEAVKRWASESADEREAASRAVCRQLERDLAPVLSAMRSDDPEVRRRARSALESLLPRPVEEPAAAPPQVALLGGGGNAQLRLVVRQAAFVPEDAQPEVRELKAKGLSGHPVDDPLLREHLNLAEGRGFAVTGVDAGSDAERLGLKPRDILLSVDGRPVKQVAEVLKALAAKNPPVRLLRRGKLVDLPAREGEGGTGEGG